MATGFLKGMENHLRLLNDKSISDIKDTDFDRLAIESQDLGVQEKN